MVSNGTDRFMLINFHTVSQSVGNIYLAVRQLTCHAMKTITAIVTVILMSVSCGAPSAKIVKKKPDPPLTVARPPAPYAGAVWIGDAWRYKRGKYVYVKPHYVKPRRGKTWVDGNWQKRGDGYVWVKGRWE